jgi:uncharacterized protein (DUF2267 family)
MNYDTFVDRVTQRAGVSSARAVDLTRATLETLTDRMTGGEILDLAAQLPAPLRTTVQSRARTESAERFDAAEFTRRVSLRAGVEEAAAADGARAVFTVLHEAITGGEFDDLLTQLPRDYRELVEPAMTPGVLRR